MDHPDLIVYSFMENLLVLNGFITLDIFSFFSDFDSKMESDRPESLHGANSLDWGSNEVHALDCCPCGTGGISRKGLFFCKECNEHFCNPCRDVHGNLKIARNHTIVSCELLCGPCIFRNIKRETSHYCKECSEYFCDTCKDFHGSLKESKSHTVLSGAKMPKHFNTTDIRHSNIMWLDKRIRSISKVNIRIPDDSEVPWITGCCSMTDGQAVLCDRINHQIKLLD